MPKLPPALVNACLTSATVRLLLSVMDSTNMAIPPGPYPSKETSSRFSPSSPPDPLRTARSMVSFVIFAAKALSIAVLSLGLSSATPPPNLAETVISLIKTEKTFPLLASWRPFLCFMLAHLECPAT